MISKFAIQAGLGVTVVGGGIGIAVWKLKKTPIVPNSITDDADHNEVDSQSSDNNADEPDISDLTDGYLVKVSTSVDDQPTEELTNKIGEKDKNYFCQWKEDDNTQQEDKDCVIKQIKFDADKKAVFLSKIIEEFNSTSDNDAATNETLKKENLKNKKNWFFLKIKGYKFDLEAKEPQAPNIDIVFSSEAVDKDKKYTNLKPIVKISGQKATQGKTRTFLVKHTKDTTNEVITDFQCKWNGVKEQECYIYKFEKQPTLNEQSITEISLASAAKLNDSVIENHYYIISFKTKEQVVSSLNTNPTTIIVVSKTDDTSKKVGKFTVINPMLGIIDKNKNLRVENLILLN